MSNSNPTDQRMARLEAATDTDREAARQAYIKYAKANREIGAAPESFASYLYEWLTVRDIHLPVGEEASPYERRDYSPLYRSGER